mmetsp:Transcript_23360/g.48872  ORF Transcript_23360/g.48872 Transcript_23360/m.48872 type:complete len:347 (-) Transcript_23360:776-1816(-)
MEFGQYQRVDQTLHAEDFVYLNHGHEGTSSLLEYVLAAADARLARGEWGSHRGVSQANEVEFFLRLPKRPQRPLDAIGPRIPLRLLLARDATLPRRVPLLLLLLGGLPLPLLLRPHGVDLLVRAPLLFLQLRHADDAHADVGLLQRPHVVGPVAAHEGTTARRVEGGDDGLLVSRGVPGEDGDEGSHFGEGRPGGGMIEDGAVVDVRLVRVGRPLDGADRQLGQRVSRYAKVGLPFPDHGLHLRTRRVHDFVSLRLVRGTSDAVIQRSKAISVGVPLRIAIVAAQQLVSEMLRRVNDAHAPRHLRRGQHGIARDHDDVLIARPEFLDHACRVGLQRTVHDEQSGEG